MERTAYDFQTAITRVNRNIASEGLDMLYRHNVFVLVTANTEQIFYLMDKERVPIVAKHKIADFRAYRLRVHIEFPHHYLVANGWKLVSFITVAEGLDRLIRFIRMESYLRSKLQVYLHFKNILGGMSPLFMQELLNSKVELFRHLSRKHSPVTFLNKDSQSQAISQTAETDPVTQAWSFYHFVLETMKEGDDAFKQNQLEWAGERYKLVKYLIDKGSYDHLVDQNSDLWTSGKFNEDAVAECRAAFFALMIRQEINFGLVCLRDINPKDFLEATDYLPTQSLDYPPHDLARLWHYRGLALTALGVENAEDVDMCFEISLRLNPRNREIQASAALHATQKLEWYAYGQEYGNYMEVASRHTIVEEED